MAILTNPITLPASKMIATMTSFINDIRFNETLAPSDLVDDLVQSCTIGKVDYGKGIVYTYKTDLQPISDLSETTSAFTITKPKTAQETIIIDKYKKIPISTSEILSKDAVNDGNALDSFYSFVMSLLSDTATFHFYDICNDLYQSWVPTQDTQTIEVPQKSTTGLSGADLLAVEQYNATQMAKIMRKTLNNMKIKNTKFTDVENQVSALRTDNLKLVMNDAYETNFLADAMASLFHSERVGEMIPGVNKVVIPTDAMTSANSKVIGWLSDRQKFAKADFYNLTMSITDPSTTYTNSFYHISYGLGVFKHAPGVVFKAVEE